MAVAGETEPMRVLAALGGGWRFCRFRGDWARGLAVAPRFGEGAGFVRRRDGLCFRGPRFGRTGLRRAGL